MKKTIFIVLILLLGLGSGRAQELKYTDFYDFADKRYQFEKNLDTRTNLYLKKNVVHIFLDENGNTLGPGFPTTAAEGHRYQIHLFVATENLNLYDFLFHATGSYRARLSIMADSSKAVNHWSNEPTISELKFSVIGPFVDQFTIEVQKKIKNSSTVEDVLPSTTIDVARTYHVSLGTGIFMTTLQNPSNIRSALNSAGDSTLLADDTGSRGLICLSAVYYPMGRNFLFPASGGLFSPERFGVLVGMKLNGSDFENFLGGVQFDFARSGSIALGAHYGRRKRIRNHRKFNFGEQEFVGDLNVDVIEKWDWGFFIGVNADVRILGYLFPGLRNGL